MKTSKTQKPPSEVYDFERGLDPWHADAFKGTIGETLKVGSTGERAEGWLAVDAAGNVMYFVPDGTKFDPETGKIFNTEKK